MASLLLTKNIKNYNLWFHDFQSNDWTINGYEFIMKITNIENFWYTFNNINLNNGMYYFIEDGYLPLFEHPKICDGYGYTNRIPINDGNNYFIHLSVLLFNNLFNNSDIVCVSFSPKVKFSVVRLWTLNEINECISTKLFNIKDFLKILNKPQ